MDCQGYLHINDIGIEEKKQLIDFSGGKEELKDLAQLQLEGTVALFNIIRKHKIAYLADEVGMGKTYMALGVVALMRRFTPSLTVLYIVPRKNLLEKWYERDYPNFINYNYNESDYRVKYEELDHSDPTTSAKKVPKAVKCENLKDLINYSSTGYYLDYFITMNSFSFRLSDTPETLRNKLEELHELVPSFHVPEDKDLFKDEVKIEYAKTINRILPDFDLIVIDEAHNFRKGPETSYRNKLMGIILGTWSDPEWKEYQAIRRVRNALLLSATPFESGLWELKNQLQMVGFGEMIPNDELSEHERNNVLKRFMVRRLNELTVGDKKLSRNMYRNEKRAEAAISLEDEDDKVKLVTALVQKKVGELLSDMKGQYQAGLLASFESYIPSTKKVNVAEGEFDENEEERNEAKDNSIIKELTCSYNEKMDERTLPHPKMEKVVEQYGHMAFCEGEKWLIFVRRIQSVHDLKNKFDDYYDVWLEDYLCNSIQDKTIRGNILEIYDQFKKQIKKQKDQLSNGESSDYEDESEQEDPNERSTPDNFFTYFFRGKFKGETEKLIKPSDFRKDLTEKKAFSQLFQKDGDFYIKLFNLLSIDDYKKFEQKYKNFFYELIFSILRFGHGFIDMYLSFLEGGKDGFLELFISKLKLQKENNLKFSTYKQLEDLIQNFDLIVKTNFTNYKQEKDLSYRQYISNCISPLAPIIGAKGGNTNKSSIARRFRLPGYPMILISTNVFQEGEDLHTFCRRVSHYGLSGSPIAIEQKTGRVDRIGCLAHRLIKNKCSDSLEELADLGIQVEFPFIKESIESTQVRDIANRLNEFMTKMHEFDSKVESVKLRESDLADRSPIPPLIKEHLRSPFDIDEKLIRPEFRMHVDIDGVLQKIESRKEHFQNEIKKCLENELVKQENLAWSLVPGPTPNALLLKITYNDDTTYNDLKKFMQQEALPHFRRACLKEGNVNEFKVYYDAHLLVEDQRVTQLSEIKEALERVKGNHAKGCCDCRQIDFQKYFKCDELESFWRNHHPSCELKNDEMIYSFPYGANGEYRRKQKVTLKYQYGYIIMTSNVLDLRKKQLNDEKLLHYTLDRNSRIDIVEFLFDDNLLFARVAHPIKDLQPIEFMYYSYVLACEADHLEHILQGDDYY